MFNILQLNGSQDWLLFPTIPWSLSPEYKVLEKFIRNLLVVNDLAEKGVHLIHLIFHFRLASDCNNRVQSKDQRVALF